MERENQANENVSIVSQIFRICIYPKEIIRQIIDENPNKLVLLFAIIKGIFDALSRGAKNNVGDTASLPMIFLGAIIIGTLFGIITLYIISYLVKLTGEFFNGKAELKEIRTAIAWGPMPYILFSIVFLIPEILIFGIDMYRSNGVDISSNFGASIFNMIYFILSICVSIWSIVTVSFCISEVQKISIWRGFVNILLAILIISVFALLIIGVIIYIN
ncbi:MAG: YIP1 family protein [Marinisporobacter sp.]|jgi:hypothetical protein|nr:YIP1 family protein [Marinisporobacter sp.]